MGCLRNHAVLQKQNGFIFDNNFLHNSSLSGKKWHVYEIGQGVQCRFNHPFGTSLSDGLSFKGFVNIYEYANEIFFI